MVIVGILPGALSPEPHFRRLIILAIGIDILKGAGIYGIGVFVVRFLPRMVAVPAIMAALVPYALSEWNTFFYKALVTESSSKNSPVAAKPIESRGNAADSCVRVRLSARTPKLAHDPTTD
jgi:ABC-type glycerol-3-phosphate transport system permease component